MQKLNLKELKVILRPLWFYCLLILLSYVALAEMPQGNDMMYCIIEDTITQQIFPLLFLAISTIFLGLTLYFISTLILWVADLSSDNLPDEKKEARRNYAKNVPQLFLYLPIFILNFSFVKAFLIKEKENEYAYLITVIIVLTILIVFAVRFVFKLLNEKLSKIKYASRISMFSILYFVFNFIILLAIKTKDSPSNYLGFFASLFAFSFLSIFLIRQWYKNVWTVKLLNLVKSINPNYNIAPIKSVFRNLYIENVIETTLDKYSLLVNRLVYLVVFSLIVVVGFNFFKISVYEYFGGIGIIVFSFACWGVIYGFVSLYSKIKSFMFSIGLKTVLIALLISSSYFNNDHKIRFINESKHEIKRKSNSENIVDYFDKWAKVKFPNINSLNEIPVVFIAAEGGAFRTGCYSAYMLNTIQNIIDSSFNQSIFCYSTVSGGTFGCNLFNSMCLNKKIPTKDYDTILNRFFSHDYLSPLTAKLAYGEMLGYFIPIYISNFDRMTALEKSWEIGIENAINYNKKENISFLDKNFKSLNPENDYHNPVLLINTTEINSGRRYIISNIKIDTNYSTAGDYFSVTDNNEIRYSTAIGLSAKFPIVSPAGTYIDKDENKYQFLDGGYYENKGAQTLYETLTAIMKYSKYKSKVKPIVIQFSFGDKNDTANSKQGINTFNEVSEILAGIYNVRSGHAQNATFYLQRFINKNTKGSYFEFSPKEFNTHKLPMNWVLSKKAIDLVKSDCKMQFQTIDSIKKLLKYN